MDAAEKLEGFLKDLGLEDKVENFKDDGIDLSNIAELTEDDFKTYGINKKGDRLKLAKAVKKFKQSDSDNDSMNVSNTNADKELKDFLESLGIVDYFETFQDDEINMSNIADLTDEELKGYGMKWGKRKDFLAAVKKLCDLDSNHETQYSSRYSGGKKTPAKKKAHVKAFTEKEVPRIVLLGRTGSGKSTLGNLLLGENKFGVSLEARSCTDETSDVQRGFWGGDGEEFEIIDSPGLNDSEGRDTDHIANMVKVLKGIGYVHAFVIVRNGQDPRLSKSHLDMFRIFEMAFGGNFWEHVEFDVSRGGNAQTRDAHKRWIQEIRDRFPETAKAKLKTVSMDVEEQDEELDRNLQLLWDHITTMPKFECKNITAVMEEKDKLAKEKAELEKNLVEERKSFIDKLETEKAELKAELKNQQKEELEQALVEERKAYEDKLANEKTELENSKKELENRLAEERKTFEDKLTTEKAQLTKDLEDRSKEDIKRNIEIERFKIKEEMKIEVDGLKDQLREKNVEIEKFKMIQEKIITERDEEKRKNNDLLKKLTTNQDEYHKNLEEAKEKMFLDQNKKVEQEKDKIEQLQKEVFESENDFREKYPSLFVKKGNKTTPGVSLIDNLKKTPDARQKVRRPLQVDINIPLKRKEELKNRKGGIAARMFKTQYPSNMVSKDSGGLLNSLGWFSTKEPRMNKTVMLLGMTGTGKSSFIDAFVNYLFDIRYEDTNRLRLIEMTRDEKAKKDSQAQSQTDHIVVYQIQAIPDMKIFFDLTIIDTPGFGDTRGIGYDKKLMRNIEDLFKSKKIESLDAIGFVAKAGDARLTAQQKYIFESILHIFGKNVEENLISILTCYDGTKVNIFDSFEEANMHFEAHITVNSEAIFQHNNSEPVTRKTLESNPRCVDYHEFFKSSDLLVDTLAKMDPKPLNLTVKVLEDRENIEIEMQGLHMNVNELLMKKSMIDQQTNICNQHKQNADATADTEYEVEEQHMKKEELEPGTYVTNCLICNRTCHAHCTIPNDDGKSQCGAMRTVKDYNPSDPSPANRKCSSCPGKCHWSKHFNSPYRFVFDVKKVKKTYKEILKRHQQFMEMQEGQNKIIDALKEESEDCSLEIQGNVQRITICLENLQENALRPDSTSSSDYINEMISAEEHEKKPGWSARIKQLREEKDKADRLIDIQAGADPDSL